ncbi:MAG: glycosyltransferase [Gammaproteobacteria bacterium]|nr:glycosyltransferase [Gammaproteobacteria bacterium]
MDNVLVIGPVLPFRGGIAQHSTLLARALADQGECRILSFKRLYPLWLFPGESDRDAEYNNYHEPHTDYLLDSINPLTWRKAVAVVRSQRPDFVLIPWWTFFLGPMLAYIAWSLRRHGIEVVFFCHNVVDHEAAFWKRALARLVLQRGSRFVVHSHFEEARLRDLVPGAAAVVHPHPIYDQFPEPTADLPRRAALELLFYGFVRPYKGLDVLIEAMSLLHGSDIFLTVAGEFWEGEQELRRRLAASGLDAKVEVIARYVSETDTANLFQRADLVVLPYRSATGSGVIPIAYRYGKPVVATRVGGLPDVVEEGRTGFLVPPESPDALAEVLSSLSRGQLEALRPHVQEFAARLTWQSLASAVQRGQSQP